MAKVKTDTTKAVLEQINKIMGRTIVQQGSSKREPIRRFSSGSLGLDIALGGGYPHSKQIELAGAWSVGKTHLAMAAMIEVQKKGGVVAYIDLEASYDVSRAAHLGLDVDSLILAEDVDWLEQGLDIMEHLIPVCDLIVFDSIGGSSTRKEYEGTAEDEDMGVRAKRLTRTVPKLGTMAKQNDCALIWINQLRDNLKPHPVAGYNNTPGGNNFKHQQSIRVFVKRGNTIEHGPNKDKIGHIILAEVVKNKTSPPLKKAEIPFLYESGISTEWEVLEAAVELDLIKKSGAYYKRGDVTLGQGTFNTVIFLQDNPEVYQELYDEVSKSMVV